MANVRILPEPLVEGEEALSPVQLETRWGETTRALLVAQCVGSLGRGAPYRHAQCHNADDYADAGIDDTAKKFPSRGGSTRGLRALRCLQSTDTSPRRGRLKNDDRGSTVLELSPLRRVERDAKWGMRATEWIVREVTSEGDR